MSISNLLRGMIGKKVEVEKELNWVRSEEERSILSRSAREAINSGQKQHVGAYIAVDGTYDVYVVAEKMFREKN